MLSTRDKTYPLAAFDTTTGMASENHSAVLSTSPTVSQQDGRVIPQRDCLACRVTGTIALGTVGAYALHMSRAHQPGSVFGKRIMAGVGAVFLGLSALRAAGDPRERCALCFSVS